MSRAVVSFVLLGEQTIFCLSESPDEVPGLRNHAAADVTPLASGDAESRGKALLDRLETHAPVLAGLESVLRRAPASEPVSLYFEVGSESADRLPWEELYAPAAGFVALDRRWPVARIASQARPPRERAFLEPLSIVAVLSAAGRSGLPQLRALLDSTAGDDARAVGTRLLVISGEQAVLDEVAGSGRPDVTAQPLAPTAGEVQEQILEAKPAILHMLCHGGPTYAGVRTLSLATLPSFEDPDLTAGVSLTVSGLAATLLACETWLAVLGACQTAEASDGPALAHALANAGVPGVIGMRRLVDLADTNRFCTALYPTVLAQVRAATDRSGPEGPRPIDWAPALTAPRLAISGALPPTGDGWSDPVLYVQGDPLKVYRGTPALSPSDFSRLRGRLDVWEAYRARIDPATTPPLLIEDVDARIAELRAELPAGPGP